jgi:hypothetical protein
VDLAFHPISPGNGARSASLSLSTNVAPALSGNPIIGTANEYIALVQAPKNFGSTQLPV